MYNPGQIIEKLKWRSFEFDCGVFSIEGNKIPHKNIYAKDTYEIFAMNGQALLP